MIKTCLDDLFTDGAVIQRDEPVPVWGWTKPDTRVAVSLGPLEGITQSTERGFFCVWLPALEAGGPYTLTVKVKGEVTACVVNDIWAGEVWVASGQSNMAWTLSECGQEGQVAIEQANDPLLRLFSVTNQAHLGPGRRVRGDWCAATPETARAFSAVAYHFARMLRAQLGVPVGMVVAARGGTFIQAWMSRSALLALPDMASWTREAEAVSYAPSRWESADGKEGGDSPCALPPDPGNEGLAKGWASVSFDDVAWTNVEVPCTWQQAGHDYSGVFWYRRSVRIPPSWVGRALCLHIGAVDKQDITYVNGIEVGRTGRDFEEMHWSVPRVYTVPASVNQSVDLVLAVRAYSFIYQGGMIGPAETMKVYPLDAAEAEAVPLAGSWKVDVEHDLGKVVTQQTPGHLCANSPHILYDNCIEPLRGYPARGALWYQGESNAGDGLSYRDLLKALVADWRRTWAKPEWPFYVVQLPVMHAAADYDADSGWAEVREGQRRAVEETPGSGLVVTLDLGEANDIHPTRKADVAARLVNLVRTEVYGLPTVRRGGPLPREARMEGDRLHVYFTRTGDGLKTRDRHPPKGFRVAGADGVFHAAQAEWAGPEAVRLRIPDTISMPAAVRYAWANHPQDAKVTDSEGIPASPFHLDVQREGLAPQGC